MQVTQVTHYDRQGTKAQATQEESGLDATRHLGSGAALSASDHQFQPIGASFCFPDISYETARKRLRRLQQAGFTGSSSSGRMEGRGRPELIYFLTTAGAKVLEQNRGISWETIPTGPPHTYHKEHFCGLSMSGWRWKAQSSSAPSRSWSLQPVVNSGESWLAI